MPAEKTNKISIYLLKSGKTPNDVLKKEYEVLDFRNGIFYYDRSYNYKPSWVVNFFRNRLNDVELLNRSSKGIYFVKIIINREDRYFAIPFGHGHSMIDKNNCVDDFGLKLVLNIVDKDSIRKIGKRTLSSDPKNTMEQLSKLGRISDFGIDIEQDLIEEITGKPKVDLFCGQNLVTGKIAFSISVKADISNITSFLQSCFEYYKKTDYQENFAFIDQVKEIKDTKEWNDRLIKKLKDNSIQDIKLWMAIPEIIDWEDVAGFSYVNKKEKIFDDIILEKFIESLSEGQRRDLDLDFVKHGRVTCFRNTTDEEYESWSFFQCMYCEITKDDRRIILTNGRWYEIAKDFVEEIEDSYLKVIEDSSSLSLFDCSTNDHEDAYNKKLADNIEGSVLMDRKNIRYGGGSSAVEFCDVFDAHDKTFIHVKNYYGSSALSHLFAQGRVSGQLFINDKKFRVKAKEKEIALPFNPDDEQNPEDYKIIFGVISKSENNLDLPFFSKVNFKNEKNLLNAFGFKNVYLVKIKRN